MNLVRFNPFWEWRGVPSLMDRIFDDTFSRFFEDTETSFTGELWSPAVDVSETDKDIVFTAEFPGFEKKEIDITVDDSHLIISGERKFSDEGETKRHRVERWYGKFYRSFLLPKSVAAEKISAKLKKGVLTVTLPKKEEAKPRQIPVSVS